MAITLEMDKFRFVGLRFSPREGVVAQFVLWMDIDGGRRSTDCVWPSKLSIFLGGGRVHYKFLRPEDIKGFIIFTYCYRNPRS